MIDDGNDSFPIFVYAASSDTRTASSWEGASFINGNQSAELAMISGVGSSGALDGNSYWTWKYDNPATYNSTSIARKWGSASGSAAGTAGGTVSYYFDAAANWSATEKAAFVAGLTLWSDVANIQFSLASSQASANQVFYRGSAGSGAYENSPSVVGHTVGGSTLAYTGTSGISIDTTTYGWQTLGSFSYAGGYAVETVVHEAGHLIGLGHGGAYNGDVTSSAQQAGNYDTRLWTLMSYIEPTDSSAKYYGSYTVTGTDWQGNDPTTWMPLDILAAQQLYGVAKSTPLSGGQVFGFNCNVSGVTEQFFDFTINKTPVITLWDAGTGNTLDLSGYSTTATVNLNAGAYSSFAGMTNNMAIAYGTAIDTVIGTSGDDIFYVNTASDTIKGGSGTNTVIFSGTASQYSSSGTSSAATVTALTSSLGGTDTLTNVRYLQFSDKTVDLAAASSTALYDFYFLYNDGSYYYGTVADSGSYGYKVGQVVSTAYGYYDIYAAAGATTEASGTVTTNNYYDVTSNKTYTPYYTGYGYADGSGGLKSEYDYTYGAKGYAAYGIGGAYEAKQGGSSLYDFYFVYNDGSYYYGTAADNGSYGYKTGQAISTAYGYYEIYAAAGTTAETSGTVTTNNYYDVTSKKTYTPYYTGYGYADGSSGLGSEVDYTYGAKGYAAYGAGGYYEAKQGSSTNLYDFYFVYNDGSYYYGTVADNGSYGYKTGQAISTAYGYYDIYASVGATTATSGTISTNNYYDATSKQTYNPYYTALGYADGSSGLGSEIDYTYGAKGYAAYGAGGVYEAKQH